MRPALVRTLVPAALLVLGASACQTPAPEPTEPRADTTQVVRASVAEIVTTDAQFSTLAELLDLSGVVPSLQAGQPRTFFAPTNAAFAQVSPALLDELRRPEQKARLVELLMAHVASGRVTRADLRGMATVTPETNAAAWPVVATDTSLTVGGARVVEPDLLAANGVVHVVDKVLLPPSLR